MKAGDPADVRGVQGLAERVGKQVQHLRTAFATWAPGLVGNASLDPLLDAVPGLVKKAEDVEASLVRVAGGYSLMDLLAAGPERAALQELARTVDLYLASCREFERDVARYYDRGELSA